MTAVMDEATGQVILHNTTYKRKKWFLQSVNHRRKPMNQAVSADLPTGNKARIAYLHCIKDGKNIDIILQRLIQFNYPKKCCA